MKIPVTTIILLFVFIFMAHAGDHFGDYLDDQIPSSIEYPLWLKICAWYILRLLIGGMIFFSLSGYPEKKILSLRGVIGIIAALLFLVLSIIYNNLYQSILEIGLKGIALLIGGVLLFGLVIQPIINYVNKDSKK